MPIYEYQCTACAHQFESLQKMTDEPLVECPQCHQQTLSKLVSAAGFQLKGTGWYVTDYSKKKTKAETNKTSGSNESSGTEKKSTETKTDTKSKDSSGSSSNSSGAASS